MNQDIQQASSRLIVNPSAGRGRSGKLARRIADALGVKTDQLCTSNGRGEIRELVTQACRAGVSRVIVAGGDGTVFEAINGLMASPHRPLLGIIPVGTGNDFIKAAGIPLAWRDACQRVLSGRQKLIDIGRCNELFFANGVGIGLDAEIGKTAEGMAWFHGPAVYLAAAFRTLAGGISGPEVDIRFDDGELVQKVTLIAVSNGSYYGGLFHIAPDASITDGILDLLIADHVTRLKAMRLIPKVMRGDHMDDPAVRHAQTRRVSISSATPLPVQIDGELIEGGLTELDIEVRPASIELIC